MDPDFSKQILGMSPKPLIYKTLFELWERADPRDPTLPWAERAILIWSVMSHFLALTMLSYKFIIKPTEQLVTHLINAIDSTEEDRLDLKEEPARCLSTLERIFVAEVSDSKMKRTEKKHTGDQEDQKECTSDQKKDTIENLTY
jgi:hypothetical protein